MREAEQPEFHVLGWYSPSEAAKLLAALEAAGIETHADFSDGVADVAAKESAHGARFGAGSQVLIAVASSQEALAHEIHAAVLGSATPDLPLGHADQMELGEEHALALQEMERADKARKIASAVKREVADLDGEIQAIKSELQEGGQSEWRMQALNQALSRNLSRRRAVLSGEVAPKGMGSPSGPSGKARIPVPGETGVPPGALNPTRLIAIVSVAFIVLIMLYALWEIRPR